MKKQSYGYLTIIGGISVGLSSCMTPTPTPTLNPEVIIQIDSEYHRELTWGDIEPMLHACALRGLCDVEINGFLFELPATHWNAEGRDDDPLFLQNNSSQYSRGKLKKWGAKHSNDEVKAFFGEMIDFDVVKDVITTLNEQGIYVRFRRHKEANSIQISLYGLHPQIAQPDP
jgi:hypothetical protein